MVLLVEGTGYEIVGVNRGDMYNEVVVRTINTVDDGDTIVIDLTKYGIHPTGFIGVTGYIHTTANSIAVQEDATTSVSGDNLTLAVGGATDNKQRYYFVKGFST